MKFEVKVPQVGESISEATIGQWLKKTGEMVKRNEVLMLVETDKASVEVVAENDGVLTITVNEGTTVPVGSVVGSLDSDGKATAASAAPVAAPAQAGASVAPAPAVSNKEIAPELKNHLSPAVQRVVNERGVDPSTVTGSGKDGRLTKSDVMSASVAAPAAAKSAPAPSAPAASRPQTVGTETRVPMTNIRKKIAQRLKEAQNVAAILTTFNEIDMSRANELRLKYKDKFKEKYGTSLGFMGLFVKAAVEALKEQPAVNASIEGNDIVYKNYYNVAVAVSSEKGLLVPVVKNAQDLTVAGVEQAIKTLALKARDGKITPDDLAGGTFTISNGGVFGSLMSTPILTPPQVAILGMHKVEDRPVAINGKVEIRPMMYVALSYDHRIIDGKEAVTFLVRIKELIEDPERLLLEV